MKRRTWQSDKVHEDTYDQYTRDFLQSPVYVMHLRDTINTAAYSYKVARVLSLVWFAVAVGLLLLGAGLAVLGSDDVLSLVFGGFGAANALGLMLYRPIERIQSGVNDLIRSQIICLSFTAQQDSIARNLASMVQSSQTGANLDQQLRLVGYLQETTSQIIADLDRRASRASPATGNVGGAKTDDD